MKIILCDNKECRKQLSESEVNSIDITEHGKKSSYDLCDSCYKAVMDRVKGIESTVTEEVVNNDEVAEVEIEDKPRVKRGAASKQIENYGVDKLRKEYIKENVPADELAKKIGVSKAALTNYLKKHNIKKYNTENDKVLLKTARETRTSIDGNWLDIDANRYKPEIKRMLHNNEEFSNELPVACRTCGYRNFDNNHCWYTMVTDLQARNTETECNHYVDIRKLKHD